MNNMESLNVNNMESLNTDNIDENYINKNIIEVSNIYPNDMIKQTLKADNRSLISYIRSEAYSICRSEISFEYIKSAFNKFKQGFVYYSKNIPIAFCIWKIKNHLRFNNSYRELYIYLLCGKKLDYKLIPKIIDDLVDLCRKSNVQYITLQPINDTIKQYYIKCGFEERQDIMGTNMLVLDVNKSRIQLSDRTKSRIKTQKQRRNKLTRSYKN